MNDTETGSRAIGRRRFMITLVGAGATVTAPLPASAAWDSWLSALVSDRQLTMMANQTWTQIRKETPLSTDAELARRVETVGQRLATHLPAREQPWRFSVLAGDQLNAFALPNGQVAFYEGIFQAMENDAQLATVMGHEIAHVTERHAAERVGAGTAANLGMQALTFALQMGEVSFAKEIAAVLGVGVQYGVLMPYNRGQELEADQVGLRVMARAGFDPSQSIAFWRNMAAAKKSGGPPELLSTHPSDDRRIQTLQSMMPEAMAIYRASTG